MLLQATKHISLVQFLVAYTKNTSTLSVEIRPGLVVTTSYVEKFSQYAGNSILNVRANATTYAVIIFVLVLRARERTYIPPDNVAG